LVGDFVMCHGGVVSAQLLERWSVLAALWKKTSWLAGDDWWETNGSAARPFLPSEQGVSRQVHQIERYERLWLFAKKWMGTFLNPYQKWVKMACQAHSAVGSQPLRVWFS
jgi:hypothetical protein